MSSILVKCPETGYRYDKEAKKYYFSRGGEKVYCKKPGTRKRKQPQNDGPTKKQKTDLVTLVTELPPIQPLRPVEPVSLEKRPILKQIENVQEESQQLEKVEPIILPYFILLTEDGRSEEFKPSGVDFTKQLASFLADKTKSLKANLFAKNQYGGFVPATNLLEDWQHDMNKFKTQKDKDGNLTVNLYAVRKGLAVEVKFKRYSVLPKLRYKADDKVP